MFFFIFAVYYNQLIFIFCKYFPDLSVLYNTFIIFIIIILNSI